nr:hypothetical protein [Glycomyces sp. NRRL B-16210]
MDEVGVEFLGQLEHPHQFRLPLLGLGESCGESGPLLLQLGRVDFLKLVGQRSKSTGPLCPEKEAVQESCDDAFSKILSQVGRGRMAFGP